jgi:uncharacterized protein (DUF885 family)
VALALAGIGCPRPPAQDIHRIADDYIRDWVEFYPSRALAAGRVESAQRIEDFREPVVDAWITANRRALDRIRRLPQDTGLDERIDRRLLERQISHELFEWAETGIHRIDPQLYSNLVNHALTPILVRDNLDEAARLEAVAARLDGLETLCATGRAQLVNGRPSATEASIRDLRSTADFIQNGLVDALGIAPNDDTVRELAAASARTAAALRSFADWLELELDPMLGDAWGEPLYARRLAIAYGPEMTPDTLERIAGAEIETSRELMADLARRSSGAAPTTAFDSLVDPLLAEMESHRAHDQQQFLQEFLDLINRSRQFLIDTNLVDLPDHETLYTALSPPHFAGAAVGGVYSAGPFDPEAETLFYLPSVPDDAPEDARDGFYRSFNTHFNTMIITHEIYPGHYLQLKAAAAHPSRVRPLFAGDDFTEGWATFCEQMMLDAGWDDDRVLTRMAHLRKRLENAVRAYVSVQVHCRGWDRDRVHAFAVERGLLPPQFADNLWHRAVLTPIQLPSYFVGFRIFDAAWRGERDRLGAEFSEKAFNNAVLASGGVPMDLLDEVLDGRVR